MGHLQGKAKNKFGRTTFGVATSVGQYPGQILIPPDNFPGGDNVPLLGRREVAQKKAGCRVVLWRLPSPDNYGRTRTPCNFGGDNFGRKRPPANFPYVPAPRTTPVTTSWTDPSLPSDGGRSRIRSSPWSPAVCPGFGGSSPLSSSRNSRATPEKGGAGIARKRPHRTWLTQGFLNEQHPGCVRAPYI